MREAVFSELPDPGRDLFARIFMKEPTQFGAVPKLQGAFDDGGGVFLRGQACQVIFLKEGSKGNWDGRHILIIFLLQGISPD